jgi:hypothetical protein
MSEMIDLYEKAKREGVRNLTLLQKQQLYVFRHSLTTVYFIAAPDVAMIKIGKTVDLKKRMATLRTMSPAPLELACTIEYDAGLEARIHQYLKKYRSHGEWFHATKEVVDFMRGYCDEGIHWVVARVGDCPGCWIDHQGTMTEGMRDAKRYGSRYADPDYCPNTQNVSGIDFSGVSG